MKHLPHRLRMILFKNIPCDKLTCEFERVLKIYGCKGDVNIIEDNKAIIVDISPYIQFIKKKGPSNKIYEMIPDGSPLAQYKENERWQKRKKIHSKSQARQLKVQMASQK